MKTSRKRGGKRLSFLVVICVLVAVYILWCFVRPLPRLAPTTSLAQPLLTTASKLNWPAQGQSAVGIIGTQIQEAHGAQTPVPTASTAKLITALMVLQNKPLAIGQPGPTITLTAADVALYNNYAAQDGSVVPVQAGEQISEYQMLQTIMLPSANNMADSLAIWAYGSLPNYQKAATQYLKGLGLSNTHIGSDASGLSPTTTSTASDMVQIGELAMQQPVLAQIAGQSTVDDIPVVGTIYNVNSLLGSSGIVGIKTGNNDQDLGAFVSASQPTINGAQITIVTAVMDSSSLPQALRDSQTLVQSAQSNFSNVPVVQSGAVAGSYTAPWGGSVKAVANGNLSVYAWNGSTPSPTASLQKIKADARKGSQAGTINLPASLVANQQSVPVVLQSAPSKPPLTWRLKHPF